MDSNLKVKNQSVVKIRNLMYSMYISTEIKKLDGDAGEEGNNEEDEG